MTTPLIFHFLKQVPKGKVIHVACLNETFAVFRGEESGKVFITDPYCPHLGANIAVKGMVKKDCISCPYHGWKFDGDTGHCVDVPYSNDPSKVNIIKGKVTSLKGELDAKIWSKN